MPKRIRLSYTDSSDEAVRQIQYLWVKIIGLSDKKQVSSGTSASNYAGTSTSSVADTPDLIAARANKAQIDPSIGFRLGEKERQLSDSFVSPTGGYVTPAIKDAIMRSGQRGLMQQAGEQTREGQYDVNRLNQTKDLALAGLTRGTTQTSSGTQAGTTSGTVKQSESPWATIAGTAASVAPISL